MKAADQRRFVCMEAWRPTNVRIASAWARSNRSVVPGTPKLKLSGAKKMRDILQYIYVSNPGEQHRREYTCAVHLGMESQNNSIERRKASSLDSGIESSVSAACGLTDSEAEAKRC